jgi:hypothetical protein
MATLTAVSAHWETIKCCVDQGLNPILTTGNRKYIRLQGC